MNVPFFSRFSVASSPLVRQVFLTFCARIPGRLGYTKAGLSRGETMAPNPGLRPGRWRNASRPLTRPPVEGSHRSITQRRVGLPPAYSGRENGRGKAGTCRAGTMDTRVSLLQRLRTQDDGRWWKELDDLYRPFIRGVCLRRDPTLGDEADDLAQEVLTVVIRKLATFEWQQVGSFRAWLRAITWNVLKAHWDARQRRPHLLQGGSALAQLEDPHSELSRLWDQEHNQHVAQRLLERVAPD